MTNSFEAAVLMQQESNTRGDGAASSEAQCVERVYVPADQNHQTLLLNKQQVMSCRKMEMWKVLKSFCRWTSVRGVPHIIRSKSPFMAIIWGIFVAIIFIANVTLIVLLFQRYIQRYTIENIKTLRNVSIEFPAVTLCNVDPVNTDRLRCLTNKNSSINKDYCKGMHDYAFVLGLFEKVATNGTPFQSLMEDSSKISVFYQMIGMEAAAFISHQRPEFIIDYFCKVTYRQDGGNLVQTKCSDVNVTYTQLVLYNYFNCYTLRIGNITVSNTTLKMSMVLYIDEEESLVCQPFCTHQFTEWSGSKVLVHPVHSYPYIDKRAMNLMPGASNQILINEVRKSENANIGKQFCLENPGPYHVGSVAVNNLTGKVERTRLEFGYSYHLCMDLLLQQAVIDTCKCYDSTLPIPWNDNPNLNYSFCGNTAQPNVSSNLRCKQQAKLLNATNIVEVCRIRCEHLEYFVELTQLIWPQKPQILNHVKHMKDYVFYEEKLKQYTIIEDKRNNNTTVGDALRLLLNTTTFEKNFLQVDVNRPSFDIIQYKQNEEYSLPTFLSQIGGVCTLFIGFTFVTIMELIELVCRLGIAYNRYPSNNVSGSVVHATTKSSASANYHLAEENIKLTERL